MSSQYPLHELFISIQYSGLSKWSRFHHYFFLFPQAQISDCVQLMASRAKASDVAIFLDVIGKVKVTIV